MKRTPVNTLTDLDNFLYGSFYARFARSRLALIGYYCSANANFLYLTVLLITQFSRDSRAFLEKDHFQVKQNSSVNV